MSEPHETGTIIDSIPFRAFSSALRSLGLIDPKEFDSVGLWLGPDEKQRFEANPYLFFIRLDDDRAARLWRIVQARMPAELREGVAA